MLNIHVGKSTVYEWIKKSNEGMTLILQIKNKLDLNSVIGE